MTLQDNIVFKNIDVNLYYDTFHAIKNLNFDIYKNQITALIGPFRVWKKYLHSNSKSYERFH